MTFYNRQCEKINYDIDNFSYLNKGNTASIYYNNDLIFKKYYYYGYQLKPEIFDIMKNISSPNLMKIYDIYMQMNKKQLVQYKNNDLEFTIDAYIAKYYKPDKTNILYKHKDYLLENIYMLEKICQILSEERIILKDIKYDNTILTENNIVLIDYDCFEISNTKRNLLKNNKLLIKYLVKEIMAINCLSQNPGSFRKIRDIFDFLVTRNTNLTDNLSKKLQYVQKPIELIK